MEIHRQSDTGLSECFSGFSYTYSNVAEQLVEKGLASVVRHKRDDEDRSSDYDKLMAAEQMQVLGHSDIDLTHLIS